ncbi:DNA helicase protein [Dioscorea alata]|uniref:DNA helicase protein n=1 Tax=Dioscorea alata TaxID=55571 RepID=A0ACB7UNC4_DIOAL|nr:DNA helicase protein [Dioscorea alata]
MADNEFKETLRPCSSSAISDPNPPLRKPPKSSISQQLLRLDPPDSLYQLPRQPIRESPAEDKHGEPTFAPLRPQRESRSFSLDPRGPYEPLVVSSPGEFPLVQVPASINCRLLEHQREGVRFLYSLYKNDHGGVLGDDMGLGKTIQTIAFLAAVFGKDAELVEHLDNLNDNVKKGPVLIVCPASVIHNWENEFSEWADFDVAVYHGPNCEMILEKLQAHCIEILITSFDTFRIHDRILSEINWEIVVVDEAHRLKNEKSRLYKACLGIKTKKRLGLTGTIMQNKILELFNLFDWVSPGSLGTREHFRDFYEEPLKHGQRLNAPDRFVQVADKRKQHLVSVLRKYLLRRTKEETIGHLMLGKEDNVVFCAMSELQKRVYKRMLEQPDIQCLINKDLPCSCGSPLTQAECCHRIVPNGAIWSYLHKDNPEGCDSCPFCLVLPCLIKLQQISNHLELIKPNPKDEIDKQKKDAELTTIVFDADIDLVGGSAQNENFMGLSDVEHCGKMRALEKLLLTWTSNGDKILLFSYSVRMLNILEKFLIRKGYCFSRLDGSTPTSFRQSLVDDFNRSPSKQGWWFRAEFGQCKSCHNI